MSGSITVTTTIDWPDTALLVIRKAGIGQILDKHRGGLLKLVRGNPPWPVDTGNSRDLWRVDVEVDRPDAAADLVISNAAEYVEYVHAKGNRGYNVLTQDVVPVIEGYIPAITADVQAAIAAYLNRPGPRRRVTP